MSGRWIWVFVALVVAASAVQYRPVVLWHGLGDNCCLPFSMGAVRRMIEQALPGIAVYSLMIGNNIAEDELNGYILDINKQLPIADANLTALPGTENGFNFIGFSQGGLFARAWTQRYNSPRVHNLISVGGPQMGVFGFPDCPGANVTMCNWVRELLDYGAYIPAIQSNLVPAEYWCDPLNYATYLDSSVFLPDINNQLSQTNATYKSNLASVNNFTLVMFEDDTVVTPKESEHFAFYTLGQAVEVTPLENSTMWSQDLVGLRELAAQNRLSMIKSPGNHLQFTEAWFLANIVHPLLADPISAD